MKELKEPNRRCREIITAAGYYYDNWLVVQEGNNYIVVRHKMTLDRKIIAKDKRGKFTRSFEFTQGRLERILKEESQNEVV